MKCARQPGDDRGTPAFTFLTFVDGAPDVPIQPDKLLLAANTARVCADWMRPFTSASRAVKSSREAGFLAGRLGAISKHFQIRCNDGIKFRSLGLLLAQRGGKALHFFVEGLAVVLDGLCADVAAGS